MRLRRETGDFKIVATNVNGDVVCNSIPKDLLMEDLIGVIIEDKVNNTYMVVDKVSDTTDGDGATLFVLKAGSYELEYNPKTGEVSKDSEG